MRISAALTLSLASLSVLLASGHKDPRDTKSQIFQAQQDNVFKAAEQVAAEDYTLVSRNDDLHTLTFDMVGRQGKYTVGVSAVKEDSGTNLVLHFILDGDQSNHIWMGETGISKKFFNRVQGKL